MIKQTATETSSNSWIPDLTDWNISGSEDMQKLIKQWEDGHMSASCFQCGKIVAEVRYAENGPDLSVLLKGILLREKMK